MCFLREGRIYFKIREEGSVISGSTRGGTVFYSYFLKFNLLIIKLENIHTQVRAQFSDRAKKKKKLRALKLTQNQPHILIIH